MRRHLTGIGLAIVMVLAMFFAGAWGYVRLLRLPAQPGGPLSALPAHGGSLLSNGSVLAAMAAVAGTAVLAGILVAAPRISALAAGLPGLLAIAWQALYLLNVRRAVQVIPLRGHAFGAGWEALLFNGILGAAGLAMIIPLFLPSRWRRRAGDGAEEADADDYMADLKAATEPDGPARRQTGAFPAADRTTDRTTENPVPAGAAQTRPSRTGLVGRQGFPGQPAPVGPSRPGMRPRPYRRPPDDL